MRPNSVKGKPLPPETQYVRLGATPTTLKRALTSLTLLALVSQALLPGAVWAEEGTGAALTENPAVTENLQKAAPLVRGQILDLFKKKSKAKMGALPFSSDDDLKVFDTENKIDALGKIIKNVERGARAAKTERRPVVEKREGLESLLKSIDAQIAQNSVDTARSERAIQKVNTAIIALSRNIAELDGRISSSRKTLSKYFNQVYVASDSLYAGDNDVDLVRGLVLARGNVSDLWNDLHFRGLLQEKGKEYVDEYRSTVARAAASRAQLRDSKEEKLEQQALLAQLRQQLVVQRGYKEKILAIVTRQEGSINRSIALRQGRADNLKSRLADLMDEYVGALQELQDKYKCGQSGTGSQVACASVSQYYSAEKKLREEGETSPSPFAWPVAPTQGISAYFRDQDYFRSLGSQHEAIDVVAAQGTEVKAAADGYLLYAEYPAPGKYAYAVVKHADGWITVYGHLSEIYAQQFSYLKRGQAFAKSGGQPGTPGAGPVTSGAHLHFEAYARQEAVDPMRHLDLSYVPLDVLDSKYVYKYAQDLRQRYGPRANVAQIVGQSTKKFFFVAGDTESERQRKIIEKYAVGGFKDWEMWTTVAAKGGVDASMVMCIGLSETGLGRYVKSANNVGNVGNNDRGDVAAFKDAKTGVQAIVNTLNNKYLSKYDTIDMLSRWGNDDDQIYASSSGHWHDNMVKCLSALKGRFVEDNLAFRYQ